MSNKFQIAFHKGMSDWVRIMKTSRLLKMALKQPIGESADPASKRFGLVQEALGHEDECTSVLPDLSLGIRNLTMSLAVHEVTVQGGEKAPKN